MTPGNPPAAVPGLAHTMAQAGEENFPVASLLLPRRVRRHLLAIYGFARLTDDIGDEAPGDRTALLDWLEADLVRTFGTDGDGGPRHPVLQRLAPTVAELDLPIDPFRDLIEANRLDQVVHRYETFEELCGYCRLSANPVGRLVLAVFGVQDPSLHELSDHICTALQLIEHCQDVGEDARRGRVYLPAEDMARHGCTLEDLLAPAAGPRLRQLMAFEVRRARAVLEDGAPLVAALRGRPRLAIAGFVAGGHATLDAIESADHDVLSATRRAARVRLARRMLSSVVGR